MSRHYVAFDPGKVTGWAMYTEGGHFVSGQNLLWEIVSWWDTRLTFGIHPDHTFCEDFIITAQTAKKSRQTDPLDGIGALKYLSMKHGVPLKMQPPAVAKTFATDDKLKALGWYTPTKGGHANDASRHLLVGLTGLRVIDLSQLLPEE